MNRIVELVVSLLVSFAAVPPSAPSQPAARQNSFAWRQGIVAEIEIVVLLVMIALTLISFWRVRPLAGVLLLPYLVWVSYATALTFALVQRNSNMF